MNKNSGIPLSFFCALLIITAPKGASADPARGEILEFGTFKFVGPSQYTTNPSTLDGGELNAEKAQFIKKTDRIPAVNRISFGFRYKLTGITEKEKADFKMVVSHPPIKNARGGIERQYSTAETLPVHGGAVSEVTGYSLDRPEELVPGVWTFEIWYHGQKLATQSFTIYSPYENPDTVVESGTVIPVPIAEVGHGIDWDEQGVPTLKQRKYMLTGLGGLAIGTYMEIKGKIVEEGRWLQLAVEEVNGKKLDKPVTIGFVNEIASYGKTGSECVLVGFERIQVMKQLLNLSSRQVVPRNFETYTTSFVITENKTPDMLTLK